LFTSSKNL